MLLILGIIQLVDFETAVIFRVGTSILYAVSSYALLRNMRLSREVALVLLLLVIIAALFQLVWSVFGVSVRPVPARIYVSLLVSLVVLAVTLPSLVWLWRKPARSV